LTGSFCSALGFGVNPTGSAGFFLGRVTSGCQSCRWKPNKTAANKHFVFNEILEATSQN